VQLSPSIFKAYDIRGIIDQTLNADVARLIGQAFGSEMRAIDEDVIVIGRDGRLSGPELIDALTEGLLSTGVDVIDLGMVATPMVYFAANHVINGRSPKSGIMITGSHNPPNYNGFKMVLGTAAIYGEQIQGLYKRIEAKQFATGQGKRSTFDVFPMYLERIVSDVKLARPMKIAIDCGNGVGGAFAALTPHAPMPSNVCALATSGCVPANHNASVLTPNSGRPTDTARRYSATRIQSYTASCSG
jgi:phosphomannomutase/phosphoglucomutase